MSVVVQIQWNFRGYVMLEEFDGKIMRYAIIDDAVSYRLAVSVACSIANGTACCLYMASEYQLLP